MVNYDKRKFTMVILKSKRVKVRSWFNANNLKLRVRIVGRKQKQTDRKTDRHTDRQTRFG